jgi:hypothetical protein
VKSREKVDVLYLSRCLSPEASRRRHRPPQHVFLLPLDARYLRLRLCFWIIQNGARTTTPRPSKLWSRMGFQLLVFVSVTFSRRSLPTDLLAGTGNAGTSSSHRWIARCEGYVSCFATNLFRATDPSPSSIEVWTRKQSFSFAVCYLFTSSFSVDHRRRLDAPNSTQIVPFDARH